MISKPLGKRVVVTLLGLVLTGFLIGGRELRARRRSALKRLAN